MNDLNVLKIQKNKHPIHNHAIQIDIKNLSKSFGKKKVLEDIQLSIQKGEFVAIIGKSGCGKSTLLRLVAGLETLTSGELLFNKISPNQLTSNITMMYQDSRLLPWKKVIENVGLGLTGNWTEEAEEILDAVDLLPLKDQWPATLSGGQKQRVALARALIHKPSLLLLDEPLSALDAFTRLEMQNLIENFWKKSKFTTLLVTHDLREAIRLADRIILIEIGQIVMDIKVNTPRPRQFSEKKLILLEEEVLNRIMN